MMMSQAYPEPPSSAAKLTLGHERARGPGIVSAKLHLDCGGIVIGF